MGSLRLAVARDEAFCFYYEENLREMERAGLETVFFSPLKDERLPEGAAGLYIGGGYPELHGERLEANERIRVDIKQKVLEGMPVLAECGGFMFLMNRIYADSVDINRQSETEGSVDSDGYGMCGVIDAECSKQERLVRFGYVEIADGTGSWLEQGETVRGHEFHYFDSTDNGAGALVKRAATGSTYREIHITDTMWAGWPHLYLRSCPQFARSFARKCRRGIYN